jgi:2-polyprenyl-6-methoxyphenol hydroxylase-like FAD-dependent oxidoreductase
MAPWGVAELQRLDLYDRFIAAGGHHVSQQISYDELAAPEDAEQRPIPIAELHAEIPGPLCMEHVVMQDEALDAARERGTEVLRGVAKVKVRAGPAPEVSFEHAGKSVEVACRLVVGADGRSSTVRRQLGLEMRQYPMVNLIAGLLIKDAEGWPEDQQSIGKVGDMHYLVFPQGRGRIRLYTEYSVEQRGRFAGASGAREMLKAFDMPCVPNSDVLANATPIGPCRSMPSQCSLVDVPFTQGAVLIGDAAGYNDPILGQGLSITLRDARMVADALTQGGRLVGGFEHADFSDYAGERRERMRRLRSAAEFITALNARFGPEDVRRRKHAFNVIGRQPEKLAPILGAVYLGPESSPAEAFTEAYREAIFGSA